MQAHFVGLQYQTQVNHKAVAMAKKSIQFRTLKKSGILFASIVWFCQINKMFTDENKEDTWLMERLILLVGKNQSF